MLTLAPEVPGHLEAIEQLAAAGFLVQLGHTLASYEQAREAFRLAGHKLPVPTQFVRREQFFRRGGEG